MEGSVYWWQLCALSQSRLQLLANTHISHHTELPHTDINLTGQRPALRRAPSRPNTAEQSVSHKLSAQLSSIFKWVKQFGSSFDFIFLTSTDSSSIFLALSTNRVHTGVLLHVYLIYVFNVTIFFFFLEEIKGKILSSWEIDMLDRYFFKTWGTYQKKHREWWHTLLFKEDWKWIVVKYLSAYMWETYLYWAWAIS